MTLRSIPPLPGTILRHQILKRMHVRQADLARAMGVSTVRINQIINGHAPISVEMALRLGQVTGTEPDYWLHLQCDFDVFRGRQRLSDTLDTLPRIGAFDAPKYATGEEAHDVPRTAERNG